MATVCGIPGWNGVKPGDPDNNVTLAARTVFGGIEVTWSYPASFPEAVAHTLLYRSTSSEFGTAIERAVVSGSQFQDNITVATTTRYYYWIKIVSVHGTVGERIGPASANAENRSDQYLDDLSEKIHDGLLAVTLREKIQNIIALGEQLVINIEERIAANSVLAGLIADVQSGLTASMTYINSEITNRKSADGAFINKLDTYATATDKSLAALFKELTITTSKSDALIKDVTDIYVAVGGVKAVIGQEKLAWVKADEALAYEVSQLYVTQSGIASAVRTATYATVGYAVKRGTNIPYDGDQVTVIYPAGGYPSSTFPQYINNRTRIIDRIGAENWNGTPAGNAIPVDWLAGFPLATAIQNTQVAGPDGGMTGIQQAFASQQQLNGKFTSTYTVKIQTDGAGNHYVGGFGLFGTDQYVEAGFDVDTFWIGKIGKYHYKPFIVDGDTVYIENAVIRNLNTSNIGSNAITIPFFKASGIVDGQVTLQTSKQWLNAGALVIAIASATGSVYGFFGIQVDVYIINDNLGWTWIGATGASASNNVSLTAQGSYITEQEGIYWIAAVVSKTDGGVLTNSSVAITGFGGKR